MCASIAGRIVSPVICGTANAHPQQKHLLEVADFDLPLYSPTFRLNVSSWLLLDCRTECGTDFAQWSISSSSCPS
jgi:hypothetical protein